MERRSIDRQELFGWEFAFDVQDDGIEYIHHPGYEQRGQRFVRPPVTDEVLLNPGIGYLTFNRFNGDHTYSADRPDGTDWGTCGDGPPDYKTWFARGGEKPASGSEKTGRTETDAYPPCTTAYFRWYWAHLEPEKGKYRWDILDWTFEQAALHNQVVQFRLMPHDSTGLLPEWYKKEGKVLRLTAGGRERVVPDYSDPLFRSATEKFVHLVGERYGNHPLLDAVDIGTLGYWGEWHLGLGAKMGDEKLLRWAVDLYFDAFPKAPLMMLIGQVEMVAYAVSRGAGWRSDCWGDRGYGTWSHMTRRYPRHVVRGEAVNAWKTAPVSLETCGVIRSWYKKSYGPDYDLDYTLDEAVRWHSSTINNKSSKVPEEWKKAVEEHTKRLGYRYQLRDLAYQTRVKHGEPWVLDQWWVNVGNAPCYHDWRLVVRLRGESENVDLELPHKLKDWLPGDDQCPADRLVLPKKIKKGSYELQIGICRAGEKEPVAKPANKGRTRDGWLRIGHIEVGS